MTTRDRVVFYAIVPFVAVTLAAVTVTVSREKVERAVVVYGPREWPAGGRVPLRVAVFSSEEETEPVREVRVRGPAGRATLRGPQACEAADVTVAVPRDASGRLETGIDVRTPSGTAHATLRVPVSRSVRREAGVRPGPVAPALSGDVFVHAAAAGGSVATSAPVPVYFRLFREDGSPWSGRATLSVAVGALQERAPGSIDVGPAGVAEVRFLPLLGDLLLDVTAGTGPARIVVPVRPARPTIHVADPAAVPRGGEVEVRSASGARCAYVDLFVGGTRRHALSVRLRGGRARFRLPADARGLVTVQAGTYFRAEPESMVVRNLWVGVPPPEAPHPAVDELGIAVPAGLAPSAAHPLVRWRLASEDGIRYPTSLLVDGGVVEEKALDRRRRTVRSRAVAGILLCALAEVAFLTRTAFRSRRRARAVEEAAARETGVPERARSRDLLDVVGLLAAGAAGFAVLAAIVALLTR